MTALQIVIKAAALKTVWLGVATVTAGTAAAAAHGNAEFLPAMVCAIFAVFAQCTYNVYHRYVDELKGFGENREDLMLKADDMNRSIAFILREGIKIFGLLMAMAGMALLSMAGWWTILLGLLIAVIVLGSNIGKHPFSQTPFYPLTTFLVFGPIGVIGTELVQSQRTSDHLICSWELEPALILGVIIGLMTMNAHIRYGAFHRRSNIHNRLTTFYGRFGQRTSAIVTTVSTIAYTILGVLSPFLMDLGDWYYYLPVPVIAMAVSFRCLYLTEKGKGSKAWTVALANIMFVAVASLVIMLIIGYPYRAHDPQTFI